MNKKLHLEMLAGFSDRIRESERFHMGIGNVHRTLERLRADLDRAAIDYAVVGGMALNAHGYRRETVDVNVLVRPQGLGAFREAFVGRGYRPAFEGARKTFRNTETGTQVEFLVSGDYPGDGKPKPVVFPDPKAAAVEIDGVRVVELPTLINLKLASGMTMPGRRRDLADVQDLIRVLGLNESFAESLDPYVRPMYHTLISELSTGDPHSE